MRNTLYVYHLDLKKKKKKSTEIVFWCYPCNKHTQERYFLQYIPEYTHTHSMLAHLCKAVFVYKSKYNNIQHQWNKRERIVWVDEMWFQKSTNTLLIPWLYMNPYFFFYLKRALQNLQKSTRSFYCCIILILTCILSSSIDNKNDELLWRREGVRKIKSHMNSLYFKQISCSAKQTAFQSNIPFLTILMLNRVKLIL